jgi:hypothetical protein
MRTSPPSRAAWLIDSELHGHTVEQVIRYLSDCADADDVQARQRALPVGVCLAGDGVEPRWQTTLARWFGR